MYPRDLDTLAAEDFFDSRELIARFDELEALEDEDCFNVFVVLSSYRAEQLRDQLNRELGEG